MLGLSVANVLGVPAATWIGQALGWRSALALVVVIGAITVAALVWVVPDLSAMPIGDMRSNSVPSGTVRCCSRWRSG